MKTEIEKTIEEKIRSNNDQYNVIPLHRDIIGICDNDLNTAIILTQLIYWSERSAYNRNIAKSATEWYNETGLSDHQVKLAVKKLLDYGYISSYNYIFRGHNTRWFRVNQDEVLCALDKYYECIRHNLVMHTQKLSNAHLKYV